MTDTHTNTHARSSGACQAKVDGGKGRDFAAYRLETHSLDALNPRACRGWVQPWFLIYFIERWIFLLRHLTFAAYLLPCLCTFLPSPSGILRTDKWIKKPPHGDLRTCPQLCHNEQCHRRDGSVGTSRNERQSLSGIKKKGARGMREGEREVGGVSYNQRWHDVIGLSQRYRGCMTQCSVHNILTVVCVYIWGEQCGSVNQSEHTRSCLYCWLSGYAPSCLVFGSLWLWPVYSLL